MFFDQDLKGNHLPPKTVCLTYDDGPGETKGEGPGARTRELGLYLHEQGIPATFFVIGRCAEGHIELLRQLREWGHLIGNHTYNHPSLVDLAVAGGDLVGELAQTDKVLRQMSGPEEVIFFRPPYGSWRERRGRDSLREYPTSTVAELLQGSGRFPDYVGPVNWDINGRDWAYWARGASGTEVARAYLEWTERMGRGIILLHDGALDESMRLRNQVLEATRLLVPALQERGYRFVRLDAIPQIQSARRVTDQVILQAADGRFVGSVWTSDQLCACDDEPAALGIVPLGESRLALRAPNGLYLSAAAEEGLLLAQGQNVGEAETLEMQDTGADQVLLRTAAGRYAAWSGSDLDCHFGTVALREEAEPFWVRKRFPAGGPTRPAANS